jgi:hypothetical protein
MVMCRSTVQMAPERSNSRRERGVCPQGGFVHVVEVRVDVQSADLLRRVISDGVHELSLAVGKGYFPSTAASGAGAGTWAGLPAAPAFSTSRAHRYRQVW